MTGRLTDSELCEARAWIADCHWLEAEHDGDGEWIAELTPAQIERGLERHYAGGLVGFLRDQVPA